MPPENQTPQNDSPPPVLQNSKSQRSPFFSIIGEIIQFVAIGAILYFGIRLYVAQPFIVSGSSMVPTFTNGDYLVVDEFTFHLRAPERGEVVVFRYPNDTTKYFIKRVIGLPNETISINANNVSVKDAKGTTVLQEPYIAGPTQGHFSRTLGPSEYFVMGDNRQFSSDSRSWGPVARNLIIGRVFIRLFPVAHASVLPGDYEALLSKEEQKAK